MGNNIIIFVTLIGIIIPFCISKLYSFSLSYVDNEEFYAPFCIKGNVLLGKTAYQAQFALSFFSPIVGFYLGSTPYDYSEKSGSSPSLLNFEDILSMEFGQEGKKGEGTLKLVGQDKEIPVDDAVVFTSEEARMMDEDAMNSFGLAYSLINNVNSKGFEESESTLNILKEKLNVEKIFSIEKWDKKIVAHKAKYASTLYLGEAHSDFSDESNVGNCPIANTSSPFWNCQFSQMTINNRNTSLVNEKTLTYYEVRFIVESKKIIFPKKLKDDIAVKYSSTGSKCYIDKTVKSTELLLCEKMTEEDEETIPISFLNAEQNLLIRGEIDNENALSNWGANVTTAFPTNIYFDDIDYIIMPLTVFKQFHVLFDAKNNKISFFSKDKSLLKLIEKKEEEKEKEDEDNLAYFKNHIFTTILIIAIVCLVIGLMVSICCSGKNAPTSIKIEGPVTEDE